VIVVFSLIPHGNSAARKNSTLNYSKSLVQSLSFA